MATKASTPCVSPAPLITAPPALPSPMARLPTFLAVGCGAGLLLYAGVVLRRHLARPRPPRRCTCPMADNTIAVLRDLHDGPFRFGDPTPFAMAARAEATRRIRRQQWERRRLRRRMRSQWCHKKSSQHLPSGRAASTAKASAAVHNVLAAGGQQMPSLTAENAHVQQCSLQRARDVPSDDPIRRDAATAAEEVRCSGVTAEVLSKRACAMLPCGDSIVSLCTVDSDGVADDHRDNDGYDEGVYSTNKPPMKRNGDLRKMTSDEVSLISSSLSSMSSSYDTDYSYSRSTSATTTTTTSSGSSYSSCIGTPSLMQSTRSSADSQGDASSLLAMTTVSVRSPDGIPWLKVTLDDGSVTCGGLHGSHDAPPANAQQHSQHHNSQPQANDPTGSVNNGAQHLTSSTMPNTQSSSHLHSMTSATTPQGSCYPGQLPWCGAPSPAPSGHASGGMPLPGANTTSLCTFGGGGGDSSRSPEAAYAATCASVPGPVPSLLTSGRFGGVAEEEEPYRYTGSSLMYGPPLFATEMDVTDALAELRSSVCCSGDRRGSSCLAGGAHNTVNTTPSLYMNSGTAGSGHGIMARLNSVNNSTSLHQQQLGMSSSSSMHYRSLQQQSTHHHHAWSHPKTQGYFSPPLMGTASAGVSLPTHARHTVHYPGPGSSHKNGQQPKHHQHRSVSSRTSVRRSMNWSPASSQWLPETFSTVQPAYGYDSAPRGWGSGGSEGVTGDNAASVGNGSLTHAPTETPMSQASSGLRRSMTTGGRLHYSSRNGNISGLFDPSFRSVNAALHHLWQYGRHRHSGRLRRCWRRCRRLVRRRITVSTTVTRLWVIGVLRAMRCVSSTFGGACARGWRWVIRQGREGASAASGTVLRCMRRPRWSWSKASVLTADERRCAAAAPLPSTETAKRHSGHTSTAADTAAEVAAEEAERGGLLMTDTADEAIGKIVQLLEPTPGRVPTVVVIRAPLGYDVSTDAASLWRALHLDSSSSEEGLIDIIIMEELKTGPLPQAQAKAATAVAEASSLVASCLANPAAPPTLPCASNADGEPTEATVPRKGDAAGMSSSHQHDVPSVASAVPVEPPTSPLPQRRPPPELSKAAAAATATAAPRTQAQLRISFEIYPAYMFYSLIFRAAVLQEKDWALRRAAAELFGGSAEVEDSGKGLGVSSGANTSAGGVSSAAPGSPLSLARALSSTFGVQTPAGEGSHNGAMDPFSHHPHHGMAPMVGSATALENYCLSPLSPGHFCRMPLSPKPTAQSPHMGLGGSGGSGGVAGAGIANTSSATADGTATSPLALQTSAISVGVTTSPQVVVRLSESYSFPAQPPQMVMSPPLGTQSGFKAPLGALPTGLSCSAYRGGNNAFAGAGAASGTSGIGELPRGSTRRIISNKELLFYIHVLRAAVGDGVNMTALPSSIASDVDDDNDADAQNAGENAASVKRDGTNSLKQSLRTRSGIGDAVPLHRDVPDAVEDKDDGSEDVTLLDLRQREVEPQVLLRYRFRVFQQGSRSRKALDAVVLYTQDRVELWYEDAKAMLRALPATESCQALSSLSTSSLRVNGSSPALRPSNSVGRMASLSGAAEALTGIASGRPQRRSRPRPAGLPLLSLGTVAQASTPELDRVDCRTTVANSGPLQLPAWAMEVLIRRESMRETLVRDLKEKAFRVCAIPLPDMRVHCILPPAVPRYVTAHARGFPLSRTFAEEVLSQQRALQFILLQREQENQRAIAARIRREQHRQERRERKRRERRAREEACRQAQHERQQRKEMQQKRSLSSRRREGGGTDRGKGPSTGIWNPITFWSRVVSMVTCASVGGAGRRLGNELVHMPPHAHDSERKTCSNADAAYQHEAHVPTVHGKSDVQKISPLPPPPQYRHGYPAASGGSSPDWRQTTAPEGNAHVGVILSQDESDRAVYGEVECRNAGGSAVPTSGNTGQHQRSTEDPSSSSVYTVQPLPGLQSMRAPATVDVAVTPGQTSPTVTEVDMRCPGKGCDSISADASLMVNEAGVSASSCPADADADVESRPSRQGAGGDPGSGDQSQCALASGGAPSPSASSPTPLTGLSGSLLQPHSSALANGGVNSTPPSLQTFPADHGGGGGGGSSNTAKRVAAGTASSTRGSHWTAVHTATNANTSVTPPPPTLNASSPPALGAGTDPFSRMPPVSDASTTATLATTRDAILDVAGDSHHQGPDTNVQPVPLQQPPNTAHPHGWLQNPTSSAPATSTLNREGAMHLTLSGGVAPNHMSSHHKHSLPLRDDGEWPSALLSSMTLATPNSSMHSTFDSSHGHSFATPQAVLLRQQTQMATPSVAPSSGMRALNSPRHRPTANASASLAATATVASERDARKGELHNGGCAGDRDARSPAGVCSSFMSTSAAGVSASAGCSGLQMQPHLQPPRSGPRQTSSGLLPYTYSADSVSSMYGTTHYPLYQYPDDPSSAATTAYAGVSPPVSSIPGATMVGGGSCATATALAAPNHAGAAGVFTYNSSVCSTSHVFGASATGNTQIYTSPGNSATLLGVGVGDRRAGSGIGWAGRLENWSPHSQSPHVPDSPMDMNVSAIAHPPLRLTQDTHMNRLKRCNKLLSDLLGVAGGPMRSGISFYYTYGDATALLYNASIRAPSDENILELLDRQQWEKQQELRRLSRTDGGGGGGFPDSGGASDNSASGGDKAQTHSNNGSYSMSSSATDGAGPWRVSVTWAGIGASPPPPAVPQQLATPHGSAAGGDGSATAQVVRNVREDFPADSAAAAQATEEEGCSYLDYADLAGLQDTMDVLESEQMEAQRARNRRFYSIFEHLHQAFHDTVLEALGSGGAQSAVLSPVTTATATGSLYMGLTGGVGTEYVFPSSASAAGGAGAERHTAAPHCVGHVTASGSSTPPPVLLCFGTDAADSVGWPQWRRRLRGRVCALVAWVGSLLGLARKPGDTTDNGVDTHWRSSQITSDDAKCGFDPAKLAEYFPGERIVTFGGEWCIASRLDMHNGHFGLSPLQVWMATRYSRRFAGEVYLMDVVATGGDPFYPAVRVLDEVVAHAVLYYHDHSLRDFVEDLEAELGLVYVPQTLWGRRALGLPDEDAEVQELEGLLYTATRRRQDRRRRQRAQETHRQCCRCVDGAEATFEKNRAATFRFSVPATTAGASQLAAAVELGRTKGAAAPPSACSSLAADAARDGEKQGAPAVDSFGYRRYSSTPHGARISLAATHCSVGSASDACPLLPSPVNSGSGFPCVSKTAAVTAANLPPRLQQQHGPLCHGSDRLEDEEMAEYTWIQLQDRDQEEDEEVFYGATAAAAAGLGGGDINIAPHVYDAVMEREVYDERMLLRELDHLKEFLVDNRNVLSSAMLTTAGSNALEAVFGVPATVFPFLLCARESVPFVTSIFESLSYHYGRLTYDNFSKYTYDVYHRDRPDVLRHTPRMFRMVNKSRRGCITYEELCRWMARKLSCGNNIQPNGHLLATSMSLRLPLALVAESRDEWDAYRCVIQSLSDGDDEEY